MTKPTEIEIHAGHARKVKGAVGLLDEFTENCRVAKRIYEILTENGVPATYYVDEVSTTQRQNINNLVAHHNADRNGLIVSIHFNSTTRGNNEPIGTECVYKTQKALSERIAKAIADASGLKNRGAKYRTDLGVLNGTYEPAVLPEICFVNSAVDVVLYKKHFEPICLAIAKELAAAIGKSINSAPVKNTVNDKEFTSSSLNAETAFTLDSKARREIIVNSAVAAGASQVWKEKLAEGTISDADLLGLAAKTVVSNNK